MYHRFPYITRYNFHQLNIGATTIISFITTLNRVKRVVLKCESASLRACEPNNL